MDDNDVIFGGLFKCPFFNNTSTTKHSNYSWSKRFFAFNPTNLLLQYWGSEEERIFKNDGCVRSRPRGFVFLTSTNLKVEAGEIERSMFGQKFTINISCGPEFMGRVLCLAASSASLREKWIEKIRTAVTLLKERIKWSLVTFRAIQKEKKPGYGMIENQYRLLTMFEGDIFTANERIRNIQIQTKLMNNKDKALFKTQERLAAAHREAEDQLYALTQLESNHRKKFKFIVTDAHEEVYKNYPYFAYGNFAPEEFNRNEYLGPDLTPEEFDKLSREERNLRTAREKEFERIKPARRMENDADQRIMRTIMYQHKDAMVNDLTDKTLHPYLTANNIIDNSGKEYDESEKIDRRPSKMKLIEREMKAHDVRKLSSPADDVDMRSFSQMNVWEILKADEKKRAAFNKLANTKKHIINDAAKIEFNDGGPEAIAQWYNALHEQVKKGKMTHNVAAQQIRMGE